MIVWQCWGLFFTLNFCVEPFVPREPQRDPWMFFCNNSPLDAVYKTFIFKLVSNWLQVCSVVPVSARLSWLWSWSTTLPRPTEDIPCLPESENEPARVTICTTRWSCPASSTWRVTSRKYPSCTDRWTNLPVLVPESPWPVWPSPNISETKRARMCCCSLTISSDSHKPDQRSVGLELCRPSMLIAVGRWSRVV